MQRENNGLRKCFGGYWSFFIQRGKTILSRGISFAALFSRRRFRTVGEQWPPRGPWGRTIGQGDLQCGARGSKKCPKNSKMEPLGVLGTPWGGFGGPLRGPWRPLGDPWGTLGGPLGDPWVT